MTVVLYVLSVSLVAIVLAVYYSFFWEPKIRRTPSLAPPSLSTATPTPGASFSSTRRLNVSATSWLALVHWRALVQLLCVGAFDLCSRTSARCSIQPARVQSSLYSLYNSCISVQLQSSLLLFSLVSTIVPITLFPPSKTTAFTCIYKCTCGSAISPIDEHFHLRAADHWASALNHLVPPIQSHSIVQQLSFIGTNTRQYPNALVNFSDLYSSCCGYRYATRRAGCGAPFFSRLSRAVNSFLFSSSLLFSPSTALLVSTLFRVLVHCTALHDQCFDEIRSITAGIVKHSIVKLPIHLYPYPYTIHPLSSGSPLWLFFVSHLSYYRALMV